MIHLGARFSLTRQRVHQIIFSGGAETAGRQHINIFGASEKELLALIPDDDIRNKAKSVYAKQRNTAGWRKIAWEITFPAWWSIWCASGKWGERGKLKHQFCMCRIGDAGAYKLGNVFIATMDENRKDYSRRAKEDWGAIRRWTQKLAAKLSSY